MALNQPNDQDSPGEAVPKDTSENKLSDIRINKITPQIDY